jgi:hypothetical protein
MDTPPTPSASAVLDAAAHAAAEPKPAPPRTRFIQFPLPDLLAALTSYAQAPLQHLAGELKKVGEAATAAGADPKAATREVSHFGVRREWCRANPDAAARIALCAAYLAEGSGKFLVQQEQGEDAPAAAEDPAPAGTADCWSAGGASRT